MRIKDLIIENEEKFWDIAQKIIGEYESFIDFEYELYMNHHHLVEHLHWEDVSDNLHDGWNDYQQKFADMNRQ